MKLQHTQVHWFMMVMVLLALMLTLSEARGQAGAATQFEGRPAMAGAQGGLGAQAGPPQGGIGVQGSDLSERSIKPSRAPSALDEVRQAHKLRGDAVGAPGNDALLLKDVAPPKDRGIAKDQRSPTRKVAKAAKRTRQQAHYGTPQIDSTTQVEVTPPVTAH